MTKEELIRMAREAGWPDSLVAPVIMDKLVEFAALVAAREREQCAKVCDEASRPIYMAEVTMPDPDEIGPWCDGTSCCLNCGHEWIAVWPLGAESLECPKCGSTDTDRSST